MNAHPLLRRLRVEAVPVTVPDYERGFFRGQTLTVYRIASEYAVPLAGAGYGSKFQTVQDLSDSPSAQAALGGGPLRLFVIVFQDPGKDKYHLLRGVYLVDPKTGNAAQIGQVEEYIRVSSNEEARDFIESALKMFLILYLTVAGGAALSSWIGGLIVPQSVATTYPALTNAVGQVALQTAVNGGDVEKAAETAAAGYLGAIAGGYLSGLTDSALIGKLAGTATGALLKGESVEDAVKQAAPMLLLQSGINAMEIAFTEPVYTPPMNDQPAFTADYDPWGFTFDTVAPAPAPSQSLANSEFNFGGSFDQSFGNAYNLTTSEVQTLAPAPAIPPSDNGTNFWDFARDALKVLPMFVNRNVPPPQPAQRYGTTNPAMYPVGQPVTLPDGRIVTRTPEGNLVTVNANGSVTQSRMPMVGSGAGGIGASLASVPPWAWGLGAAALVFVLKRKG